MIFLPDRPPICPGPIGLLVKSSQFHLHCSVHMGSTHDILSPISNHLFNNIPVSKLHIQRRKVGLLLSLRLADVTPLMCDSVHRRQKTPQTSWCYLSATSHGVAYHKTASSYSNPLSGYRAREVVFRPQFPDNEGGDCFRNECSPADHAARKGRGSGTPQNTEHCDVLLVLTDWIPFF